MSVAEPQRAAPAPKLRWFQFSLRTLLVFVTLFAIPCSWLGVKIQEAKNQKAAVQAIQAVGGRVQYGYQVDEQGYVTQQAESRRPVWLRSVFGDDFLDDVVLIFLGRTEATDTGLEGMEGFEEWYRHRELELGDTKFTDAGLQYLKGFTQLRYLYLGGSRITDAGLEHIEGLSQLQRLELYVTPVTDAGLEHLNGLPQLTQLAILHTEVTDAGIEHLKGLTQLQSLILYRTRVTDAGVKKLQQALPNCKIIWEPPTKEQRQSPAVPDQLR